MPASVSADLKQLELLPTHHLYYQNFFFINNPSLLPVSACSGLWNLEYLPACRGGMVPQITCVLASMPISYICVVWRGEISTRCNPPLCKWHCETPYFHHTHTHLSVLFLFGWVHEWNGPCILFTFSHTDFSRSLSLIMRGKLCFSKMKGGMPACLNQISTTLFYSAFFDSQSPVNLCIFLKPLRHPRICPYILIYIIFCSSCSLFIWFVLVCFGFGFWIWV